MVLANIVVWGKMSPSSWGELVTLHAKNGTVTDALQANWLTYDRIAVWINSMTREEVHLSDFVSVFMNASSSCWNYVHISGRI